VIFIQKSCLMIKCSHFIILSSLITSHWDDSRVGSLWTINYIEVWCSTLLQWNLCLHWTSSVPTYVYSLYSFLVYSWFDLDRFHCIIIKINAMHLNQCAVLSKKTFVSCCLVVHQENNCTHHHHQPLSVIPFFILCSCSIYTY